jgi:hypothetical protein
METTTIFKTTIYIVVVIVIVVPIKKDSNHSWYKKSYCDNVKVWQVPAEMAMAMIFLGINQNN